MGPDTMILVLWMLSFKPAVSLSSFTFIKRLFSSSSLSAKRGGVICISEVIDISPSTQSWFQLVLHSAQHFARCTLHINKQGDNMQPRWTPFSILNQSIVPCPVLTVASWPAYRFLTRQVRWSDIPISLRILHSLLWSTQRLWNNQWSRNRCFSGILWVFLWSNKCFQFDLGSSAFSKSSFNIWKLFIYCWNLARSILSITLLACEMNTIVQ